MQERQKLILCFVCQEGTGHLLICIGLILCRPSLLEGSADATAIIRALRFVFTTFDFIDYELHSGEG